MVFLIRKSFFSCYILRNTSSAQPRTCTSFGQPITCSLYYRLLCYLPYCLFNVFASDLPNKVIYSLKKSSCSSNVPIFMCSMSFPPCLSAPLRHHPHFCWSFLMLGCRGCSTDSYWISISEEIKIPKLILHAQVYAGYWISHVQYKHKMPSKSFPRGSEIIPKRPSYVRRNGEHWNKKMCEKI